MRFDNGKIPNDNKLKKNLNKKLEYDWILKVAQINWNDEIIPIVEKQIGVI